MSKARALSLLATAVALGACGRDEDRSNELSVYDLKRHWTESRPSARRDRLAVPANGRVVRCGPPSELCPGIDAIPNRTMYYIFRGKPELTGKDFDKDSARRVFSTTGGGAVVHISLTDKGQERFHALTRQMARRGKRERQLEFLAIVAGDRLVTFPSIDYQSNPDGIDSDVIEITGIADPSEADRLAKELRGD